MKKSDTNTKNSDKKRGAAAARQNPDGVDAKGVI